MVKNFAEITFTESVKTAQEKYGTRLQNERMEKIARGTELSNDETEFIAERDSFYLATVSETGHPYVQFRGGPKGFLKVLDNRTLGFADFRGNLQYISTGNLSVNDRAALILMDYPNQQRLKILARVEIKDASDVPEMTQKLQMPNYKAKIERVFILHVEAFDWNCPQHITPRFTIEEIKLMSQPLYEHVEKLEAEIKSLKSKIDG